MNATATTEPQRRGWGFLAALRELTRGGRTHVSAGEAQEPGRIPSAAQRDRLRAGLPFDGSDCE
jgi:hypothetical protein